MRFKLKAGLVLLLVFVIPFFQSNAIRVQPESKIKNIYIPALCYHRVTPQISSVYDLTPEMLEEQIRLFIGEGYQPITVQQFIKLQKHPEFFPDKPILLTFDDGSKGHYQYVFPLLQKYEIKATFFVYPSVIAEKSDKMITWSELLEMSEAGMDIESHTMSHPFLTKRTEMPDDSEYLKWLDHELKDSKRVIEEHLKTRVTSLAYSYGWHNRVVEEKCVEAGYQAMLTVNWGCNRVDENPYRIKRRVVSNAMSLRQLQKYIASRPLSLEIISPEDSAIIAEVPEVQFRLTNRELNLLDIEVGRNSGEIKPNGDGVFSFHLTSLYSGYNMIIVSGYDGQKQLYMESWGFDYSP